MLPLLCCSSPAPPGAGRGIDTFRSPYGTVIANHTSSLKDKSRKGESVMIGLVLLVLLIVLLLGAVPAWPYSRNWGYGPSGGVGLLVLIVIILLVLRVF